MGGGVSLMRAGSTQAGSAAAKQGVSTMAGRPESGVPARRSAPLSLSWASVTTKTSVEQQWPS